MIQLHRPAISLFAFVFLATSCSTGAGDGEVFGSVDIPECGLKTDHFDIGADFFAADYFDNTLTIRIQNTGQIPTFADGLFFVIRDVATMDAAGKDTEHKIEVIPDIATFLALGPDAGTPTTTKASPARATLYLNDTCPDNHLAFTDGAGTLTLKSVYIPGKQKRIAGSFQLEFVDPRHWKSLEDTGPYAQIEGYFDFNYTRGKPAQTFP